MKTTVPVVIIDLSSKIIVSGTCYAMILSESVEQTWYRAAIMLCDHMTVLMLGERTSVSSVEMIRNTHPDNKKPLKLC